MVLSDIVIDTNMAQVIIILLVVVFFVLISTTYKLRKENVTYRNNEADLKVRSQQWAISELEKFKTNELDRFRKGIEDTAVQTAANMLDQWKVENEIRIRQDAINRSYSVNLGKISEHLVPFHLNFPFNPKDARFIGSPIDILVFDGASDGRDEITIYFIEVKTGNSKLSEIQKKIRRAVINKCIEWREINPDSL